MFATARGPNLECRPMFEESGLRGRQRDSPRPSAVGGWSARRVRVLTVGHSSGRVGMAGTEMSEPRSGTPVIVGDLEIEPMERVGRARRERLRRDRRRSGEGAGRRHSPIAARHMASGSGESRIIGMTA